MPCILALQSLLLSWAADFHRVAGCFQMLFHFNLCKQMKEPCIELTNIKEKRYLQWAKTSRINVQ